MQAKPREVFAGVVGYSLSVVTTGASIVDACVVIAKPALWWVGDGYAGIRAAHPCRKERGMDGAP
uniref:Uncharacterized protein n=1 Tax=mine drainage metagenome TaxID=410659 RepID=E6QKH9_9ZZZZ